MELPTGTTLDTLRQEYSEVETDAEELVAGLGDAQLTWRPSPNRWSIAHCLHHVVVTDTPYGVNTRKALERCRSKQLRGDGSVAFGFVERRFLAALAPPPKRRVSAPKIFHPDLEMPPQEVLRSFRESRQALREILEAAGGLDLNQRMASPVSPLLRLRIGSALALLAVHARRHLWQAREVLEHGNFPGR